MPSCVASTGFSTTAVLFALVMMAQYHCAVLCTVADFLVRFSFGQSDPDSCGAYLAYFLEILKEYDVDDVFGYRMIELGTFPHVARFAKDVDDDICDEADQALLFLRQYGRPRGPGTWRDGPAWSRASPGGSRGSHWR